MTRRWAILSFLSRYSVIASVSAGMVLFVTAAAYGQKPLKIGVVNFQEIALQSKAGKATKARLEKLADKLRKQVKAEEDKLLAHQKGFEAGASRLPPAERQHRAEALEHDELALKRLVQDNTEELQKAETEGVAELARQIDPIVKAFAAEKGFTIILESRRPGLLYFDKNLDITAEIVKRFDQASK